MTISMDPVNVIQYKYHDAEFGQLLNVAFTNFTSSDQQKLTIFTRDKPIHLKREPLVVFSPFIRNVLDSLPCCSQPSILFPDCSSLALQHLLNIVQCGATDFQGELNTAEILVAAKCLAIDLTNFEYVKSFKTRGTKEKASRRLKESGLKQTRLPAFENDQSDSDLDETVVDDYGEEIDEMDEYRSTNLEDFSPLKRKAQGPKVLEKEHYEKETLDENPEDALLALQERYDQSAVNGKKVVKSHKKSNSMSTGEFKQPKFRIPKTKVESIPGAQEPLSLQHPLVSNQNLTGANNPPNSGVVSRAHAPPQHWDPAFSSSSMQQGSFSQNIPLAHQTVSGNNIPHNYGVESLRPQQRWTPAMPVAPSQPFRQALPPTTGSQYLGQMRAQLSQNNPQKNGSVPLRLPNIRMGSPMEDSFYVGQPLPPTPRPPPHSMGLWAQSASKPAAQSFMPNPHRSDSQQASVSEATRQPDRISQTMEIPPTTTSTVSISTCQLCHKTLNSTAQLWQHFARVHFFAELKADYGYMVDIPKKSCNECGSSFKAVDALFLHIGTVHRKVNEIMEKKGLTGLKMPSMRTRKSM